jgi:hypothetical protein
VNEVDSAVCGGRCWCRCLYVGGVGMMLTLAVLYGWCLLLVWYLIEDSGSLEVRFMLSCHAVTTE